MLAFIFIPQAMFAQSPVMRVNDADSALVFLEQLDVDVKVTGAIATTTWTMTFRNNSRRPLEGELTFPMAEGITVSRYAIDINGKLREAVPVDKARGTTVLEDIEKRRIDPGLLERVDGNAFRTRVYPILAGATRTVLISYEEPLRRSDASALQYRLPMAFGSRVPTVNISVAVYQSTARPEFEAGGIDNMAFDQQGYVWSAKKQLRDFKSARRVLFRIPQDKEQATVLMQPAGNHYYCLISTPPRSGSRERPLTDNITILWDASLSGLNRNHTAELDLLDEYLGKIRNATVSLVVFSNAVQSTRTFTVTGGQWSGLKKALQDVVYDGGTQPGVLDLHKLPGKEFLLFSDGMATYGREEMIPGNAPVYCITSSLHSDYPALRHIAAGSGGSLIDLNALTIREAIRQLGRQPLTLLRIKADKDIEEVYPDIPVVAGSGCMVSAISYKPKGAIILQYGYGNEVTEEQRVMLDADRQSAATADLARIWAEQKIAALDVRYEQNKRAIERLGKRFGLVTRNTSLIVLENLSDYLLYDIEPPAELRAEYDRIIKTRGDQRQAGIQNRLNVAEAAFNNLLAWWNETIEPVVVQKTRPVPDRSEGIVAAQRTDNHAGIAGTLKDERGNPVVNANVEVMEAGIVKGRDMTDFDGKYSIRSLNSGRYAVIFSYLGRERIYTDISLASGQRVKVNGRLGASNSLKEVSVTTRRYEAPIIDPGNPGGGQVKTAEQIEKSGAHNTSDMAALSTQVYQGSNGGGISIGGSRNTGTKYIVDGVQLNPGAASFTNQSPNAVEAITTFSSGTLARYGDNSGSVARRRSSDTLLRSSIRVADYSSDNSLLGDLRTRKPGEQYARYLELRKDHMQLPSFYFQAAGHFIATKQKDIGLRILSNLAELELENYELYKMLGYKLRETGETAAEAEAFRKVFAWRPMDPQSLRDYGLALADAGQYQAAVDTLYAALTNDIDPSLQGANNGIEETLLCDINGIIAQHKDAVSTASIPRNIIQPTPADIRVVISWNMKNTDIDLWVTDPNDEKCFYSHKTTAIGGRISQDITQGFGPEQFMLRHAIAGNYKIAVNYYGDSQVKIAGPATVTAEVYTHWGTPQQERQIIVLQMKPADKGGVYVGEFSFGRKR